MNDLMIALKGIIFQGERNIWAKTLKNLRLPIQLMIISRIFGQKYQNLPTQYRPILSYLMVHTELRSGTVNVHTTIQKCLGL